MNPRAVICDIYGTLLAVKPPPADVEARWVAFWDSIPGMKRQMSLDEFSIAIQKIVVRERAAASAAGVTHPEIIWPDVLEKAVPEFASLSSKVRDELCWRQAQFLHTVTLMPGAANAIRTLRAKNIVLGLASNSQSYTLHELDVVFSPAGLVREWFDSSLCFFSFEHGFSKPDPAVFSFLSKRLQARGITVEETLMIGNRLDNDILPARAQGWQTWHFTEQTSAQVGEEGTWEQFSRWLG